MYRHTSKIALGAFVALAAAGTTCLADETPAAPAAASTSTVLNVKVARDKETGQLRAMTAQEEAELKQAAKSTQRNALEVARPVTTTVYHADGRMTGRLSPEDTESLLLVRKADGTMVMTHDAAAAADAAPAPKAEAATE
jgi:hypothetical protein